MTAQHEIPRTARTTTPERAAEADAAQAEQLADGRSPSAHGQISARREGATVAIDVGVASWCAC